MKQGGPPTQGKRVRPRRHEKEKGREKKNPEKKKPGESRIPQAGYGKSTRLEGRAVGNMTTEGERDAPN